MLVLREVRILVLKRQARIARVWGDFESGSRNFELVPESLFSFLIVC
jgi:hypothetical protein